MGQKATGPVCYVTHVKEPSAVIKKRRGWFDWQRIVQQHIVNHYMVLCKRISFQTSNIVPHTLQEILYITAPGVSLSDGYVSYIRSHFYYYYCYYYYYYYYYYYTVSPHLELDYICQCY